MFGVKGGIFMTEPFIQALMHKIRPRHSKEMIHSEADEVGDYLKRALVIFETEGQYYLPLRENSALLQDLISVYAKLDALSLENLNEESFLQALTPGEESLESILEIGIGKFQEGLTKDALSVFSFLTLICPDESEYWYRLGLIAHDEGHYKLALNFYSLAISLPGNLIAPHLFSSECHWNLKNHALAQKELATAKALLLKNPDETELIPYFYELQGLLAADSSGN